jgi:hypothetical protein
MDPKDIITFDISNLDLDLPQYSSMDISAYSTITISSTASFDVNDYTFTSWNNDWLVNNEWNEILKASEGNDALQKAIERVKILYYLSKEDGNSET